MKESTNAGKVAELIILSVILVALSYFFSIFKFDSLLQGLASNGVTFTAILDVMTNRVGNFDGKFVALVWALIGGGLYFFYLSLTRLYSSVYNYILIKTQFVNNEIGLPKLRIKLIKRILIHLAIVLYYVVSYIVLFIVLMPFSEIIRKAAEANFFPGLEYGKYLSFLIPFPYWVLITGSFALVARKLKQIMIGEELAEEHLPDELDANPFSTTP